MNSVFSISFLQTKPFWVLLIAVLFSANLMAQNGVAIINVSENKILSGEGIPFELSFVIKEIELNNEEVALLQNQLNTQPERYLVTLIKDDLKPELLVICGFKTETFELLNQAFHEVLQLLNPGKVLFNEQEFSDFNTIVLE